MGPQKWAMLMKSVKSADFGKFLLYKPTQKRPVMPPFELLTQFFLHFQMCYNKLGKVSENIGTCIYIFFQYQAI